MSGLAVCAARVACALARGMRAGELTVDEIAADALAVAVAAQAIRAAARRQRAFSVALERLEGVARRHGAQVLCPADPEAMTVGLLFSDGRHSCGFTDTFFVA